MKAIKQKGPYRLADRPNRSELTAIGWPKDKPFTVIHSLNWSPSNVKAVATGEFRPPKKGEWFLSGAEVMAYKAFNDLNTPYHIARIALFKTVTTEVEIPPQGG